MPRYGGYDPQDFLQMSGQNPFYNPYSAAPDFGAGIRDTLNKMWAFKEYRRKQEEEQARWEKERELEEKKAAAQIKENEARATSLLNKEAATPSEWQVQLGIAGQLLQNGKFPGGEAGYNAYVLTKKLPEEPKPEKPEKPEKPTEVAGRHAKGIEALIKKNEARIEKLNKAAEAIQKEIESNTTDFSNIDRSPQNEKAHSLLKKKQEVDAQIDSLSAENEPLVGLYLKTAMGQPLGAEEIAFITPGKKKVAPAVAPAQAPQQKPVWSEKLKKYVIQNPDGTWSPVK